MRCSVCTTSVVCSVESTRCPVSAAMSVVDMVSRSRISPTRMMSGSCRSTYLRPSWNERVSRPTSRWWMNESRSRCRNSIGSSIVMMLRVVTRLMASIMAASVVDLPEPVRPVTSTSPRGENASSRTTGGSMQVLEAGDLDRHVPQRHRRACRAA